MTLRKDHQDGHWCNALEKNIKGFIREFDDRIVADLQRLDELRSEMDRLLEVMSKLPSESNAINDAHDHSASEREAEAHLKVRSNASGSARGQRAMRALATVGQRLTCARRGRGRRC